MIFRDLSTFWIDAPARGGSSETDFGIDWRGHGSRCTYRLSFIDDTGELYLVKHGIGMSTAPAFTIEGDYPPGTVELVGFIPATGDYGRELARAALDGYAEHVGREGGLQWVADTVESCNLKASPR